MKYLTYKSFQKNNETSLLRLESCKLAIHTSEGIHIISECDVSYLESDSNYTTLHLRSGKSITCSKTLKVFENKLNERFLRAHRSFLVNPDHITWIDKNYSGLVINQEVRIPISRSRKEGVKNFIVNPYLKQI